MRGFPRHSVRALGYGSLEAEPSMERFLWVCLAGAVGTGVRYLVGVWAGERFGGAFPWATLIVNLAGCFLISLVMHSAIHGTTISPTLRAALTTGFLGGLTTYSSFNYETTRLFTEGPIGAALANLAATTLGCFGAGLLGLLLAKRLVGG